MFNSCGWGGLDLFEESDVGDTLEAWGGNQESRGGGAVEVCRT